MSTATIARKRAAQRQRASDSTRRRPPVAAIAGAVVLLLAIGLGALVLRGGGRAAVAGAAHSLGAATAPVVVEEWSDFQ